MTGKVLVTGANGHVGLNLCEALVACGYDVRASVRDAGDAAKTRAVREVGVTDLVSLDVRDRAAFERAAEGVERMFHVAATYRYVTASPQADAEMISDSIDGVEAALRAAKVNGVKKVVLTSSIVTLPFGRSPEDRKTEADWREDLGVPYMRAKTLAEKRAWDLAGELGLTMVAVLPSAVCGGRFLRGTTSTDFIEAVMKGSMRMGTVEGVFPWIDVHDVVTGHILAMEKDVGGRFILAPDRYPTFIEIVETLRRINPKIPKPMTVMPPFMYPALPFFDWLTSKTSTAPRTLTQAFIRSLGREYFAASNARAKAELGWSAEVSLEDSLRQTMAQLRAIGRG